MITGLKHTLIRIVTILLIAPVMAGVSQAAQTERPVTSLAAAAVPDKAETSAAMIITGISLILVAGLLRKRVKQNTTSNRATAGPKHWPGYVRPLLSRLNAIFFL